MKTICLYLLVFCLSCSLFGCEKIPVGDRLEIANRSLSQVAIATTTTNKLAEVGTPLIIQKLGKSLEKYQPKVSILNPKKEKVYTENTIEVRLKVKDLPLFKNEKLGLGPSLHLILDNEPYQVVYDTNQSLLLENLTPGTHTLRIVAALPWGESFKNSGAYAQTTFHVLTKTNNSPDNTLPLLTYNLPQGTYSAEPISLDFYLTNAPNHSLARKNSEDEIKDWHIKVTVNGESFLVDDWKSIYLKGFERGNNWVQLELVDEEGNEIDNVFNNTIRLITYDPDNRDPLAQLITGELSVAEAKSIVEKNYQPKTISAPTKIENPIEPETVQPEEIEPQLEVKAEKLPKSPEISEKQSNNQPKVKDNLPSVTEELSPVTEEVIETKEPTPELIEISDKPQAAEKTETTEAAAEIPSN